MSSFRIFLKVLLPDAIIRMLVGTTTCVIISNRYFDSCFSLIISINDSVTIQKIWIKLPRKQLATIIHYFLTWVNRNNNWYARLKEYFTYLFAVTRTHKRQLDLMFVFTKKLSQSFFVKLILNSIVDVFYRQVEALCIVIICSVATNVNYLGILRNDLLKRFNVCWLSNDSELLTCCLQVFNYMLIFCLKIKRLISLFKWTIFLFLNDGICVNVCHINISRSFDYRKLFL